MQYKLLDITDKKQRNNFVIDNFDFYSFLDSREWWNFQKLQKNKIWRFWIFDAWNFQVGQIMLIKHIAKRWIYFLAPHAPLIKNTENYFEVLWAVVPEIKKLAKKEEVVFLRVCPQIENTKQHLNGYKQLWFKFAPMHVHAEETHLLDLKNTEEDLLKNMRKTTRYIIRRAKKEGVIISEDNSENSINHFIHMHYKHAKRDNGKLKYNAFSKNYIHSLFKAFDSSQIKVLNAEYKNFTEASLITIQFGKSCVYYLWASEIKHPKFSPAYILQREAIKKAKESGCTIYNFWWVSPDKNPKHPLRWVSLFKRGFGGYDFWLLHAQDFSFSKKYWINFAVETLRRKKRWYYFIKPK